MIYLIKHAFLYTNELFYLSYALIEILVVNDLFNYAVRCGVIIWMEMKMHLLHQSNFELDMHLAQSHSNSLFHCSKNVTKMAPL